MSNLHFVNPESFFLLFFIPIILGLMFLIKLFKKGKKVPFSSLIFLEKKNSPLSIIKEIFKYLLTFLLLINIILAFADLRSKKEVSKSQGTVVMVVDISVSMKATDLSPNRITVLKDVAIDLVNELPEDTRMGLIFYAGSVVIKTTPVNDKSKIIDYLETLSVETLDFSTATGDALNSALDMLTDFKAAEPETAAQSPGNIVLFTDGERTAGVAEETVLPQIVKEKVKVYTIGVGSYNSTEIEIEYPDGSSRTETLAPLNETLLKKIAEDTEGIFFRAADSNSFSEIVNSVDDTGLIYKETIEVYYYYYFLLIASLLLILLLLLFVA